MKSPFKFLDSYTKDDREIFFGRDREIEELYQRVFDSKLLLVYGVSGTGKSSLIHCGLANKFQETDWLPLVIRRGGNIIESMASSVKAASITEQQSKFSSPVDFKKGVRSLYLDHYKPVFFIFDQFEELFIFCDKEERRSFIHIVKLLTESDLQCRMIFVMREEYMAWVTEFEKFIPTFFANRVRIEKMSHRNALDVIKEPCKVFNISLEERFAESLLEKLSPGSEDVELTYLQVFLDKIFRLATEDKETKKDNDHISFTMSLLQKTGNVSDLLGSFLDDQISLMEDPDSAMTVLKAFVSGKGTKRPASEQEANDNIRSFGKEIPHDKVKELIQSFVKLRVLRDKDDNDRYELRHDALAEKVYEKFSTAEKELLEIRQMIENAYQYWLRRKILLSNEDMAYISNKDSMLNLNPDLKGFVDESRKYQKAMQRTVRRLVAVSAFAFVIVLSILVYTISKRTKASQANVYAEESINQFARPVDRLSFAGLAWQTDRGQQSKEALLKAFNFALVNPGQDSNLNRLKQDYLKEFTPVSSPLKFAICSKDNNFIYGYTVDSIIIWSTDGKIFSKFRSRETPLFCLLMNDNDDYLCGVSLDSVLTVWDIKGGVLFEKKIRFSDRNRDQIFRFTKNDLILSLSNGHDAVLLDLKGNPVQSFDHHKGSVNALDISNDGLFFATASCDATINIWYYNSDSKKFDFYNTITSHSDTVWSVDFAENSRYVLSTSADCTVKVTSVNNNITADYSKQVVENDWKGYPFSAEFNDSTGMIIHCYENSYNKDKPFMIGRYIYIKGQYAQAGERQLYFEAQKFDYIKFSPDNKYFAYASPEGAFLADIQSKNSIHGFGDINNFRLLQMEGQKPFFSPDGKYIYTINEHHILGWFIEIQTISHIAEEYLEKWL
jgi:WD40 repeat protein